MHHCIFKPRGLEVLYVVQALILGAGSEIILENAHPKG